MTEGPYPFSPPERSPIAQYVQWSGDNRLLSPPECKSLILLGNAESLSAGTVGNAVNGDFRLDPAYRTVRTRALYLSDGLAWLYQRLRQRILDANRDHFRFDLTGIEEGLQFLRYDAPAENTTEPAGHYNWHQDFGGGRSSLRKLSLTIQLSMPYQYDGCDLRLFTDQDFAPPYREAGDAIAFPSWTPHMVTPITRGTRYALVAWVCGPQFR